MAGSFPEAESSGGCGQAFVRFSLQSSLVSRADCKDSELVCTYFILVTTLKRVFTNSSRFSLAN